MSLFVINIIQNIHESFPWVQTGYSLINSKALLCPVITTAMSYVFALSATSLHRDGTGSWKSFNGRHAYPWWVHDIAVNGMAKQWARSSTAMVLVSSLQWRHNERGCVSNHRRLVCLLNVCSGADQRKHQSSASLAFVGGIHRCPVDPPRKMPVTRNMFPFDDAIMFPGILWFQQEGWAEQNTIIYMQLFIQIISYRRFNRTKQLTKELLLIYDTFLAIKRTSFNDAVYRTTATYNYGQLCTVELECELIHCGIMALCRSQHFQGVACCLTAPIFYLD